MAVVDSSVLIHLSRIGKLTLLKKFFKKISITQEIYDEVKAGHTGASEIDKACKDWISISQPKNFEEVNNVSKTESIEKADASIILLAKERKDILLSNDFALIMTARSKNIECWWLTGFLLRCLKKNIIEKKEAKQILFDLVQAGMRLSNDVYAAILKEIEDWKFSGSAGNS